MCWSDASQALKPAVYMLPMVVNQILSHMKRYTGLSWNVWHKLQCADNFKCHRQTISMSNKWIKSKHQTKFE